MGLDDFLTDDKKDSESKNRDGPSMGGIDEFLDKQEQDEITVEGGITIPKEMTAVENNTEIVKIFGGPGTGKTTTMVGNTGIDDFQGILQRLFTERSPEEVMLIAYTRSAADEAKNRLVELTDVSQSKADDRITTIHSIAMRFNNLKPKDIVEIRWYNDKQQFCKEVGMEFKQNADEDEMMAVPDDEGHLFFRISSWLKSKLKPPKDISYCPLSSSWPRSEEEFVELVNEWEQFKSNKGIWEFDDAILECVNNEDTLDTRFLFVDEVQDLYPLQQAFLDNQLGHVDRIFLAGDDDQTIYEWAGAKPEYFLEMKGNINNKMSELWEDKTGYWAEEGVYILNQSFRMPSEILELSKLAINQVDERQEKEIKPHHSGGEFIPLRRPATDTVINLINPDDTMILFRAKYQMQNFGKELQKAGIPYIDRFKTWRESIVNLRDGIAALKNDEEAMSGQSAARIIKELPDTHLENNVNRDSLANKFSGVNKIRCSRVMSAISMPKPDTYNRLRRWTMEFEEANYYQEIAVRQNLLQHNEHLYPDGVEIETIHGSKGQEADTIILSTDSTQSVMDNMEDGHISDAERRLYYVGMTRTENRLVMCEGLDDDSPTIKLDELMTPEWREKHDWANVDPDEDLSGSSRTSHSDIEYPR